MSEVACTCCLRTFKRSAALQMHWNHSDRCRSFIYNFATSHRISQNTKTISADPYNTDDTNFECNNMLTVDNHTLDNEKEDETDDSHHIHAASGKDVEIMMQHSKHKKQKMDCNAIPMDAYKTSLDLL